MNTSAIADSAAAFLPAASRPDEDALKEGFGSAALAFGNVLARLRYSKAAALLQPGASAKRTAEVLRDAKRYSQGAVFLFDRATAKLGLQSSRPRSPAEETSPGIFSTTPSPEKTRETPSFRRPLHLLNTLPFSGLQLG